jgi:hypothetical protein
MTISPLGQLSSSTRAVCLDPEGRVLWVGKSNQHGRRGYKQAKGKQFHFDALQSATGIEGNFSLVRRVSPLRQLFKASLGNFAMHPKCIQQQACNDCRDCVSGCNVGAKNTTLMNYLPDARKHGAETYTEAKVTHIARIGKKRVCGQTGRCQK